MIKVVAKNVLKDGTKDRVLELLEEMIAKTRQENGCIKYELYESTEDPNTLTFIEEWEDADKLAAHMKTEHFRRIIPAVGAFKAQDDAVDVYTPLR
ncbi:MAG: antibiotic biosynthesis monooxygenase [Clostridiales Family XIII bacterium]|jgi:quinol monooxygenase YgiN|nr:antibiotic biosynthesis monooxygenase [Clostridiales Family XIII bacterium]